MIDRELLQSVEKLRQRLGQIRAREIQIRLLLGAALALLVFLPLLGFACLGDWAWDLSENTPQMIRHTTSLLLWTVLATLLWEFLFQAYFLAPKKEALVHWVEKFFPQYNHRLVTALQLTREGSRLEGYSPKLLEELAREVVEISKDKNFILSIDHSRVKKALICFLPSLALIGVSLALFPETLTVLLGRQLGFNLPIPRNTTIKLPDSFVLPEGEEGVLGFEIVTRNGVENLPGKMWWKGNKGDRLEMSLIKAEGNRWEATVPSQVGDGALWVRAGDGRAGPIPMKRMARPVLQFVSATVQRPAWYGKRPDGSPYEEPAPKGDVTGLSGSLVSIKLTSSQPLKEATIVVQPVEQGGIPRTIQGNIAQNKTDIELQFALQENDYRYQIRVTNEEGLTALPVFQRRIAVLPDDPPLVALLPEQLPGTMRKDSTAEDSDIDGLPVLVGQRFRVAYQASSPGGIRSARFRYRINEKGLWRSLPLQEFQANPGMGPFDLENGAFEKSPQDASIDFFALPSPDPWKIPSRRQAGGRFDFQIGSIKELKIGDRIEFYVEVTDLRPGEGLIGQSETRVKEVVGVDELLAWWRRKEKETEKLTELKNKQGRVFEGFLPEMPKMP